MRKFYKLISVFALLILAVTAAHADDLMRETFSYPAGPLYNQGGWLRFGTNTNAPIQVGGTGLTYKGYADTAEGMYVTLGGTNSADEKLFRVFDAVQDNKGVADGSIYLAALVNVQSTGGNVYVMSFLTGAKTGLADGKTSGSEVGRLFIVPGSDSDHFKFSISKNGANPTSGTESADFKLNETHLVIMKYTFIDGTNNDEFVYWANPANLTTEGTALGTAQSSQADASPTYGIQGIELRQGGSGTKAAPHFTIDQIRVATTWAELFGGSTGGDPDEPDNPDQPGDAAINASVTSLDFGTTIQGTPVEKDFTVSGTGLTGNITVKSDNAQFSVTPASITAEEAEAGAKVTVTYKATAAGTADGKLTLSADGAVDITVTLTASAAEVTTLPMSTQIINQTADDGKLYRYTQTATVTFVDAAKKRVYAQDIVGGLCVDFSFLDGDIPVAAGDKFSNVLCYITKEQGVPYLQAIADVTKKGTGTKEPLEITADEILASPESYIHRLVTLKDNVVFTDVKDNETFTASARKGRSGEKDVTVLPFAGTDLIGTAVPAEATVTGIVRSVSICSVSPRSAAEVAAVETPQPEAAIEVATENLFEAPGHVGKAQEFARFTVKTTAAPNATAVYLTGADAAMFGIDKTEIAAGTGETTVTVTYKPAAIGKHSARLNLDAVPTELSQGFALNAIAIDDDNMPSVAVNTETLADFSAAVGETMKQTVTVTTANLPDFGSAAVKAPASGQFIINSATLLKNGETQLTITFAPKTAGEYTDEIVLSAPYGNTVSFTVKGTATGESYVDPDTEGDTDYTLDTANPLTYYVQDFETAGQRFKPIQITGWKNFAFQGTRAWWSYKENADNNHAAYVTAYDSKVEGDGTECNMTLISPALDYKNTKSRMLTFRLKGRNIFDGMIDDFNVFCITLDGEKMIGQPILENPLTKDDNDQWREFVVDLEGQDIDDVFFVGFDLKSIRGHESTAVFMVDDFSWGRDDIPFIRPSETWRDIAATVNVPCQMTFSATGLNLTEAIALKMVGSEAASFTLSTTELPKEGGEFTVTLNPEKEGEYFGFVEMKSAGAPTSYIDLYAVATTGTSTGSVCTESSAMKITVNGRHATVHPAQGASVAEISVYTSQGTLVRSEANTSMADLSSLPAGIYIIRAADTAGNKTAAKAVLR